MFKILTHYAHEGGRSAAAYSPFLDYWCVHVCRKLTSLKRLFEYHLYGRKGTKRPDLNKQLTNISLIDKHFGFSTSISGAEISRVVKIRSKQTLICKSSSNHGKKT